MSSLKSLNKDGAGRERLGPLLQASCVIEFGSYHRVILFAFLPLIRTIRCLFSLILCSLCIWSFFLFMFVWPTMRKWICMCVFCTLFSVIKL